MNLRIFPDPGSATRAAADLLGSWLVRPDTRTLLVAAGNTPIALYAEVARRRLPLAPVHAFALDEYVGVPPFDRRTTGHSLRTMVAEAWGIPPSRYHDVSSVEGLALVSVREHEGKIERMGGLDVSVLGLGTNGHLGFNEPGSEPDSGARIVELEDSSIEANRRWFGGAYAPRRGATLGLRTLLASRKVLLLAFGAAKKRAVKSMLHGPRHVSCPASWLQEHPDVHVFIDREAAP